MNYLLVTHIPFRRSTGGAAVVDGLWAADLKGLCDAVGRVTVAAPERPGDVAGKAWGPGEVALETEQVRFASLPFFGGALAAMLGRVSLRSALRPLVDEADLVHTSNFFPPYLGLAWAHHYAGKVGKKTLFVVAEDFVDFVSWNLASAGTRGLGRVRAERMIATQDRMARECLSTASIAFLHTPAAVKRYRLDAPRGMAIRQPVHEADEVIGEAPLEARLLRSAGESPLRLVVACRLEPLKGIDFLLRALGLLQQQGVAVHLEIFGEGTQKESLVRLAAKLSLDATVTFRGSAPPGQEFRQALQTCDAAVMPHLTNDFGRAFWDAMAAGLPLIAFHSDAASDTVRDHVDGLLAPQMDVEGLADRIYELHLRRDLLQELSRAARARSLRNTKAIWNGIRLARIQEEFSLP